MELVSEAINFAVQCHDGMRRKSSKIPYIIHPLEAATIVASMTDDAEVISAAILHDVVEDTNVTIDEIEERFGKRIRDLVESETENKRPNLPSSETWRIRKEESLKVLQEASDILCAFNFLPEEFGRFKLKKKRAVIEYIEPTEKYLERRKGTIADILMPTASTFTNVVNVDNSLVYKGRLEKPYTIIKFRKDIDKWFTIWDNGVVKKYNGEHCDVVAMRPYLDEFYNAQFLIVVVIYIMILLHLKNFKKN